MRVALFGYGEGGCRAVELIQAAGHEICAIFTHPQAPEPHNRPIPRTDGIPYMHATPYKLTGGPSCSALLRDVRADCIISFWFKSRLAPQVLEVPRFGCWNWHASLLPAHRGRSPINWALVEGARRTGVTVHRMVERLDAGEVLLQRGFDIEEDDSAPLVYFRVLGTALDLLAEALPLIAGGQPKTRPMLELGPLYGARRPSDGLIDWEKPAREVHNLVRAVTAPWPGAFSHEPMLHIWRSKVRTDVTLLRPGQVVGINGKTVIGCGQDALEVIEYSLLAGSPHRAGELFLETIGKK